MSEHLRRLMAEIADGAPAEVTPDSVRRAAGRRVAGTAAAGVVAAVVVGLVAAAVLRAPGEPDALEPLPLATAPTASVSDGPTPSAAASAQPSPSPVAATPSAAAEPSASPAGSPRSAPAPTTAAGAPGSTVGVDDADKTLRIAVHGSSAGAAGSRKYWDASGPDGGPRRVLGYRVVVDHVDGAAPDCESAARSAFALVSVADAEATTACARSRVLRRDGVPYLALGSADTGLGGPNHFATSLTYRQQAPLVVRMARDNGFLENTWAVVVVGDDQSTTDARDSIVEALVGAKVSGRSGAFDETRDVYVMERTASNCVEVGAQLRNGGYGSVYFVGAPPLLHGQCVNQYPTAVYTGVGATPETAAVDPTCRGGGDQYRGFYLNPTPDLQKARSLATGAPALTEGEVPGWAAMQVLEQALTLVEGPLGRASFTRALAGAGTAGGVLNPTSYSGRTQFGGTAAYANRITCAGGRAAITTIGTYQR